MRCEKPPGAQPRSWHHWHPTTHLFASPWNPEKWPSVTIRNLSGVEQARSRKAILSLKAPGCFSIASESTWQGDSFLPLAFGVYGCGQHGVLDPQKFVFRFWLAPDFEMNHHESSKPQPIDFHPSSPGKSLWSEFEPHWFEESKDFQIQQLIWPPKIVRQEVLKILGSLTVFNSFHSLGL